MFVIKTEREDLAGKVKLMDKKQLFLRIVTALLFGVPLLFCVILGDLFFLMMIVVFTMLSVNEFYYMLRDKSKNYLIGVIANIICVGLVFSAYLQEINFFWSSFYLFLIAVITSIFFLLELFFKKLFFTHKETFLALRAIFYIGFSYSFLVLIRGLNFSETINGLNLILYLLLCVWVNDIFAYFIGIVFGRIRLIPKVSPKKSIEGALAGFIACVIASAIYSFFVLKINVFFGIIMGALISFLAQSGDLTESLLKREMKVKDSGFILPGHGGILDRLDSFILNAPFLFYGIILFINFS